MPKYLVSARETVFYDYEVTAKNEIEAKQKVRDMLPPEPSDSTDFEIISVVEDKEQVQQLVKARKARKGYEHA